MENISKCIINYYSFGIPESRNHNKIFMLLQLFFTLPFSIIICALLYTIHKKNNEILANLNALTLTDINQVEKKYRRYFSFRSQQKRQICDISTNEIIYKINSVNL